MEQEQLNENFFDAVVKLDKDHALELLEQGADVECYNNLALHQMVEDGHKDMVSFLVENGADVNSVRGGDTPLYTAINHNNKDIANYLIDNGADIKAERNAAIGIACQNQDFDIVKKMIALGGDTFTDFASNITYAALHSSESLTMVVEAYGQADSEKGLQQALIESIINENNTVVKTLLEFGVDPTKNNDNALYQAVKIDNKEIVNHLIVERKMPVSDSTRQSFKSLSDPEILGSDAERYSSAEKLLDKRDLNERLQQKYQRPPTQAKTKSMSLKI